MISNNLNTANRMIDDHESIAELFNDFFINMGKNLADIKSINCNKFKVFRQFHHR